MNIFKNMHPTDKEGLLAVVVMLGAIALFSAALWFHHMLIAC
jgi:hypothetical protein